MKLERAKNTKRNIIFGIINKLITIFLPFMIRTIIIKVIGAEYLGLNSLFASILQVLNLAELGFSNAIVFSMYKPIAENDEETICALLNFYKKIFRIIGMIVLFVGMILLPFLPKLISGTYPEGINLYCLYLIYLANTVLSYFLFAYKTSILNAYQRTDIISNVGSITQGTMMGVQIVILFLTKNYYLYILAMPIFTLINNLINAYLVDKMYPTLVCKGQVGSGIKQNVKKQVSGLMVHRLCTISRNSFDSIFVSAFLGLTTTAMYGNYYYIMNAVIGIISVITNALLAGVGNSIVLETREKNYQDLKKINFLYMWLGGWCTICLICLYQPFMKIWMGNQYLFPDSVVILFCIYFYVLKMGDIRGLYSDAAGLWWENRTRAIIESLANLILNFILVQLLGIQGIILATLISLFIINFGFGSQIVFKYYFKNGKLGEYFSQHFNYAAVTFAVCTITYNVSLMIPGAGIIRVIGIGFLCCILPNMLYLIIYSRTKSFKEAIGWVKNTIF